MPKYRVAIVGGGIAGLCLAASLTQLNRQSDASSDSKSDSDPIHIDLYEAAQEFVEVGAGITLWGRVCEALRQMGMEDDCVRASVVAASTTSKSATDGIVLRGFRDDAYYGKLPFQDAWSLHRLDLVNILACRIPGTSVHFGKRFVGYHDPSHSTTSHTTAFSPITLTFSDGSTATCDVLVGADGLRSVVRAQLMRDASSASNHEPFPDPDPNTSSHPDLTTHINPHFSGTLAYRALLPLEAVRSRNPEHSILKGGVIYFGKSQHIVGYPISTETLNLVINITNLAHVDTEWPPRRPSQSASESESPSPSPAYPQYQPRPSLPPLSPTSAHKSALGSRRLDRASFKREVAPRFVGWGREAEEVVECVDACIEWPVMDLNPLPFYTRGRVVLMGDAAHAAVPYVGAGAAFAIEDAYILSHLLHTAAASSQQTPSPPSPKNPNAITCVLHTYQHLRLPCGNALIKNARLALRSFQFNGPCGDDMRGAADVVCKVFEGAAGVDNIDLEEGESWEYRKTGPEDSERSRRGPEADIKWGVARVRGML